MLFTSSCSAILPKLPLTTGRRNLQTRARPRLDQRKRRRAVPRNRQRLSPKQLARKEEIFARLQLQHALQRVNFLMNMDSNDDECQHLYLSKFLHDCASNCRIGPSSIPDAGRGLFAAQDIDKGSIISLYPAHLLGIEVNDNGGGMQDGDSLLVFSSQADEEYFEQQPNFESACGNKLLILQATDDIHRPVFETTTTTSQPSLVFYQDVNPNQKTTPSWLSHIINDGSKTDDAKEESILEYYRETNERRNAFHIPFGPSPLMATVATRDIKQGEEFFTSYDFLYWVMDVLDEKRDSFEKTMTVTESIGQQADAIDAALWESGKGVVDRYHKEMDEIKSIFRLNSITP